MIRSQSRQYLMCCTEAVSSREQHSTTTVPPNQALHPTGSVLLFARHHGVATAPTGGLGR